MNKIRYIEFFTAVSLVLSWIFFQISQPVIGIFIMIVPILAVHRIYLRRYSGCVSIYFLFVIYLTICTLLNINVNYDIQLTINQLVKIYIVLGISCFLFGNIDQIVLLEYVRNIGAFFSSMGIIEALIRFPFLQRILGITSFVYRDNYRTELIFQSPIICGTYLGFFLCLIVLYPYRNKKRQAIVLLISIVSIVLNQSRSSWIAVAVAILAYQYKKNGDNILRTIKQILRPTQVKIVIIVFVLLILFVDVVSGTKAVVTKILNISERIINTFNAGGGNIIRIDTILKSIIYWKNGHSIEFLFGGGKNADKIFLNANPIVKGNEGFIWDDCLDNQYFTWIHEVGIIGLSIFIWMLYVMMKSYKRHNNANNEIVKLFCLMLFLVVNIFFYDGYNYPQIMMLITMIVVMFDKAKVSQIRVPFV